MPAYTIRPTEKSHGNPGPAPCVSVFFPQGYNNPRNGHLGLIGSVDATANEIKSLRSGSVLAGLDPQFNAGFRSFFSRWQIDTLYIGRDLALDQNLSSV